MFEVIFQLGKAVLHVTLLRERIERGKRWIIHLALRCHLALLRHPDALSIAVRIFKLIQTIFLCGAQYPHDGRILSLLS